jgi:outer membrane protein
LHLQVKRRDRCGLDPLEPMLAAARILVASVLAASLPAMCGCGPGAPGVYGRPPVSPAPETPWSAPARAVQPPAPSAAPAIPAELLADREHWSLPVIVDIALRNNSRTRAAWAAARSASAAYASRGGDYFPEIRVGATASRQQTPTSGGRATALQSTVTPSADLSWLLFDFGGRQAYVDEARQALIAADWTHNATIQAVVFQVEQAYYEYLTAKALFQAAQSVVDEVRTALEAAQTLHDSGLATIADVLQARTALSQTLLQLETLRGRIQTTRGVLATSMGLHANVEYDVTMPADLDLPVEQTSVAVDSLLAAAQRQRPDLQAARARVRQAGAHVRDVKAEGYPAITASGALGRMYYDDPDVQVDTWSALLQIRVPVFTGFSHGHDVDEAKADAEAAGEQARDFEQTVVLQVWTAYYDLKTAEQRLRASKDLFESATQSEQVAAGRYREGVGSILDLLAAQAALADALAARVQARSDWYLALAYLAYSTGTLLPSAGEVGK